MIRHFFVAAEKIYDLTPAEISEDLFQTDVFGI